MNTDTLTLIELIRKLRLRPQEVQRRVAMRTLQSIADACRKNWALAEDEVATLLRVAAFEEKSPFRARPEH